LMDQTKAITNPIAIKKLNPIIRYIISIAYAFYLLQFRDNASAKT
jgi:hypothetical protein